MLATIATGAGVFKADPGKVRAAKRTSEFARTHLSVLNHRLLDRNLAGGPPAFKVQGGGKAYELTGWHTKRQEFEHEYDNDAELLISEIEFRPTDSPVRSHASVAWLRVLLATGMASEGRHSLCPAGGACRKAQAGGGVQPAPDGERTAAGSCDGLGPAGHQAHPGLLPPGLAPLPALLPYAAATNQGRTCGSMWAPIGFCPLDLTTCPAPCAGSGEAAESC